MLPSHFIAQAVKSAWVLDSAMDSFSYKFSLVVIGQEYEEVFKLLKDNEDDRVIGGIKMLATSATELSIVFASWHYLPQPLS